MDLRGYQIVVMSGIGVALHYYHVATSQSVE